MKYSIQKIAEYLEGTLEGNPNIEINTISKIEEGIEHSVTFLANPIYTPHIYTTKASLVVVNKDFKEEKKINTNILRVKDAYQAFSKLLELFSDEYHTKIGIEESASIAKTAEIGENVYIGAFSYIGENVKIGKNVKIFPQTFVGNNCVIGDNSLIFPNVSIYHDSVIGSYVTIHSGTVIGADGFGFAPNNGNDFKKVPQIGNVVVEDHVEIGANSAIDRATIGSTFIRRGVKLDNFIQVAHNVEIGENTVIAALTGISGSTKIGSNCMIGGQVGIAGHLKIGNDVKVGAQSGISHNLKNGEIVVGTPAIPIRNFKKSTVLFKNLESLYDRIKKLEEQIKK